MSARKAALVRRAVAPAGADAPDPGSDRRDSPAVLRAAPRALPAIASLTGHLAGVDAQSRLLFRPDGTTHSVPVVIGMTLSDAQLVDAARLGTRALAVRTGGDEPQLVLIALLRSRLDTDAVAATSSTKGLDVKIDGETLRLEAKSKIEIECGQARICLHSTGRLEISGTYVLSRSRGPNKIRGATVEIN